MTTEDNKLYDKFNALKSDVNKFKTELNLLNEQKEHWFSEKDKHGSEIREKIKSVKKAKEDRDKLTASVKNNKGQRNFLDKEIKELSSRLDKLKQQRSELYTKHDLKGSPYEYKRLIDALETKIEVEVISFDKEKKLMKEIRVLRSKVKEFDVVNSVNSEITGLSKELNEKKRESIRLARLVRADAAKSQVAHSEMIALSKEIDKLKVKEDECYNKFAGLKDQYNKLNDVLKIKYDEFSSMRGAIEQKKVKKKKEKIQKQKQALDDMKKEVDKKLEKGKKLTTEDLKIFQNSIK